MLDAIIIKLRTTPQDLHQVWAQNANANGGPHLNSKLRILLIVPSEAACKLKRSLLDLISVLFCPLFFFFFFLIMNFRAQIVSIRFTPLN